MTIHDCHLNFELIEGLVAQLPCLNLIGNNSAKECLRGQRVELELNFGRYKS